MFSFLLVQKIAWKLLECRKLTFPSTLKKYVSHLSTNIVPVKSNCSASCLRFLTVFYFGWKLEPRSISTFHDCFSRKEKKCILVIEKKAELSKSRFNVIFLVVISAMYRVMRWGLLLLLGCFVFYRTILRNKLNLGVGYYRIPPYKADSKEGTGSLEQRS